MTKQIIKKPTEITFDGNDGKYFYAVKEPNGIFTEIKEPKVGQKIWAFPVIAGGNTIQKQETKPMLLQIPIPLCKRHFDSHSGEKFAVKTCKGWTYIAIPTELGSLQCRECLDSLFIPMPFLYSADLRSADLRSADLYSADLRSADLRSARNINETLNLNKVYWDKFTKIDDEFKKLLSKDRFVE